MAASVLVDAGFLVALLSRRDRNHQWARAQALRTPPPWTTCESVLSEGFHLMGSKGIGALAALIRRKALVNAFAFQSEFGRVLDLMEKYSDVPISLADACLVRMTETHDGAVLLTTDADFRVYRRHGRQVIPAVLPPNR
jgi:predicted nucleic acid-binding protein